MNEYALLRWNYCSFIKQYALIFIIDFYTTSLLRIAIEYFLTFRAISDVLYLILRCDTNTVSSGQYEQMCA